jgi:hypothetical protein
MALFFRQTHVLGYDEKKSDWTFQNNLKYSVLKVS